MMLPIVAQDHFVAVSLLSHTCHAAAELVQLLPAAFEGCRRGATTEAVIQRVRGDTRGPLTIR